MLCVFLVLSPRWVALIDCGEVSDREKWVHAERSSWSWSHDWRCGRSRDSLDRQRLRCRCKSYRGVPANLTLEREGAGVPPLLEEPCGNRCQRGINKSGCDQTFSNSRHRSWEHRGHNPTEQLHTRLLGLCGVWFTINQGNVIRTSRSRVFLVHGNKKLWITDHPGRQWWCRLVGVQRWRPTWTRGWYRASWYPPKRRVWVPWKECISAYSVTRWGRFVLVIDFKHGKQAIMVTGIDRACEAKRSLVCTSICARLSS